MLKRVIVSTLALFSQDIEKEHASGLIGRDSFRQISFHRQESVESLEHETGKPCLCPLAWLGGIFAPSDI